MTTSTLPFAGTYAVDPIHSSVEFAVRHMGVSLFRATFEDVSARFVSDDAAVRLEGSAPVESVSIRSPREFRDHVVFGADFFDAGNHPTITVSADDVALHDDGTVTLDAALTIRSVTRQVPVTGTYRTPVVALDGRRRGAFELTATVDRRDFGLDWQAPLPAGGEALGNEVQLTAHLEVVEEA
ncbi:YceI family protein [Pseudonocardia zijingensis]|uniref:YceI family protein n=1 Tax=Pseudonocardia zijingensis TaxID=153376 RepID=A0ABN1NIT2_9PSEU